MIFKKYILYAVVTVGCLFCYGCGADSLVGNLTMSATSSQVPGSTMYQVDATTTYSHPSKDVIGTEITTNFAIFEFDGTLVGSLSYSDKVNSSGGVTRSIFVPQTTLGPRIINISSSSGDLSQFKSVTIPAIAPLAVNPTSITFAATDLVGSTKTFAITGGVPSFNVISGSADINAALSGTTVTLTRNDNGVGGTTTIIVQDALINTATVTVTYTAIP